MKRGILFLLLMISLPISILAENVSNVRVHKHHNDIVVTYDLEKTSDVKLLMSISGSSYQELTEVEGDVGHRVKAGHSLRITWHPQQEMQQKIISDNVQFIVEAQDSHEVYLLPKSRKGILLGGRTNMETFVTLDLGYTSVPQASGGLMIGQTYSGTGWYFGFRTNFNACKATNGLVCDANGRVGGVTPFYSGKKQSAFFNFDIGVVMDFLEYAGASKHNRFNTFGVYTGIGYGFRRVLWETTDGVWIEYSPNSLKGFSWDIGLIGSIHGFTLKMGLNTIGFKYAEWEMGIGWMF